MRADSTNRHHMNQTLGSLVRALVAFIATAVLFAGCATAHPHVKVIAMSQSRTVAAKKPEVLVFMEVVNPTSRELSLSRLDYQLSADHWFESNGSVDLARRVAARSSTVVEISVPIAELEGKSSPGVPYRLRGRLFARADHVERSWKVDAAGELQTRAATFVVPGSGARIGDRTEDSE